MATKTNTELKDEIATNKLTSQLMIDMVDSLGHPQDSNGNDILTQHTNIGDLFDSSKWGTNYYSLDIGSTATYSVNSVNGDVHEGINFYNDNTNYRFKTAGRASRKTYAADGNVIEYVSSATGFPDLPVTWVETKRTDTDGNIAYNGAVIPSGLSSTRNYEFRGNRNVLETAMNGGHNISSINCYRDSSDDYISLSSGGNALVESKSASSLVWQTRSKAITSLGQNLGPLDGTWAIITPS